MSSINVEECLCGCLGRTYDCLEAVIGAFRRGCVTIWRWLRSTFTRDNIICVFESIGSCCAPASDNLERLRQEIEYKERRYQELREEKQRLEALFNPQYERGKEINRKRKALKNEVNFEVIHKKLIPRLLEFIEEYIRCDLLTVSNMSTVGDQKERYTVYGLMLSGSITKNISQVERGPIEDVKQKVKPQHLFLQKHNDSSIDASVRKALSMTWSMLTLLPPLLVTTDPQYYSEEIHDTNRHTWDENKREPLYYYRPVLVSGNALHVAVKGLVGNSNSSTKLIEL